jgi:hypothetical protein
MTSSCYLKENNSLSRDSVSLSNIIVTMLFGREHSPTRDGGIDNHIESPQPYLDENNSLSRDGGVVRYTRMLTCHLNENNSLTRDGGVVMHITVLTC